MSSEKPAKPYRPAERFLAPGAAHGDGLGYRNRPLREPPLHEQVSPETLQRIRDATSVNDEPQSLDADEWTRHISSEVDQRAKAREIERERSARLLSIEERVVQAQKDAALKRRDVRREIWILRQMQARNRPPALIEKRVQVLERVVYLGRAA